MGSGFNSLAYTVVVDGPGDAAYRTMAKLLAGSLVRTHFSGEIVVFRNTPEPLFQVERAGITEIQVKLAESRDGAALTEQGWALKYRVRDLVQKQIDSTGAQTVLFLDCDCLALRNVDHLLAGHDWDIRYYAEPGRAIQDRVFNCFFDG